MKSDTPKIKNEPVWNLRENGPFDLIEVGQNIYVTPEEQRIRYPMAVHLHSIRQKKEA